MLFRSARQETVAAADRRVDLHMPVGPYAEDRLVRGADAAGLASDPAVAALLWQAADVLGDQARDVLDLHHRHEFSPAEIAAVMNLTPEAIEDILRKRPKGLTAVVRSMVVWRQGTPAHDELATALAGVNGFDTSTVRTIAEHQRTCEACREAGKLSVDPLAVFKAIPLAVAPVGFKEIVVDRLHEDGLPIEGSVSYRPGSERSNGAAAAGVVAAAAAARPRLSVGRPTPPLRSSRPRRSSPRLLGRGRRIDVSRAAGVAGAAADGGRPRRGRRVQPLGPTDPPGQHRARPIGTRPRPRPPSPPPPRPPRPQPLVPPPPRPPKWSRRLPIRDLPPSGPPSSPARVRRPASYAPGWCGVGIVGCWCGVGLQADAPAGPAPVPSPAVTARGPAATARCSTSASRWPR